MIDYKAPLRDIRFVRDELLNFGAHYQTLPECDGLSGDLTNAIIEEGAKFCTSVLAPLNRVGDAEGCRLENGEVHTPSGFKEAYAQYVLGGWTGLSQEAAYGGQGLPESLRLVMTELIGTANWSWGMYTVLSTGARHTISEHGTEDQKQAYLTKLVEGRWMGTMCLTEPHCGTDLGQLRTKAESNDDGSYRLTGTKIFISAGDHDWAENIVHIVLARLPDSPSGTKGISLFIVPKLKVNADGSIGEANNVSCGSLEHKMGVNGNATCVMNFDGAEGYLIGPPNKGLACMFTFMNTARLDAAIQGVCHAELGYQGSLAYAKDRLQGRALSGPKAANKAADPIIVHPDVRRMLLTQRAFSEGGRALIAYCSILVDRVNLAPSEKDRTLADQLLSFLTPIAKAFLTETGFEAANHGLQCFGGHGYIKEWGMEQNVRDARISMLYEGTTGVQALDLLGRKVLGSQGNTSKLFIAEVQNFCVEEASNTDIKEYIDALSIRLEEWNTLTTQIGQAAMIDPEEVGAASVDYLMYSGYVVLAYLWARSAKVAQEALHNGSNEKEFYRAKLATANFYFTRLLPRTLTLAKTMLAGSESLAVGDEEIF